jgi:hypothetical protein
MSGRNAGFQTLVRIVPHTVLSEHIVCFVDRHFDLDLLNMSKALH